MERPGQEVQYCQNTGSERGGAGTQDATVWGQCGKGSVGGWGGVFGILATVVGRGSLKPGRYTRSRVDSVEATGELLRAKASTADGNRGGENEDRVRSWGWESSSGFDWEETLTV